MEQIELLCLRTKQFFCFHISLKRARIQLRLQVRFEARGVAVDIYRIRLSVCREVRQWVSKLHEAPLWSLWASSLSEFRGYLQKGAKGRVREFALMLKIRVFLFVSEENCFMLSQALLSLFAVVFFVLLSCWPVWIIKSIYTLRVEPSCLPSACAQMILERLRLRQLLLHYLKITLILPSFATAVCVRLKRCSCRCRCCCQSGSYYKVTRVLWCLKCKRISLKEFLSSHTVWLLFIISSLTEFILC